MKLKGPRLKILVSAVQFRPPAFFFSVTYDDSPFLVDGRCVDGCVTFSADPLENGHCLPFYVAETMQADLRGPVVLMAQYPLDAADRKGTAPKTDAARDASAQINVVLNWFGELRTRAPARQGAWPGRLQ